ncbi:MAG: ABC transporter ATP-binding protein [Methylobacteriaceae bacterium]|nr:ABC transporter ATP-binding protein [Methylobacteriaceae bacterium]
MLRLSGLSKTYPNGTQALADVTLDVPQGEIVAFVGGSGCGKTTMLRLIAGLEQASKGRVELDGETLTAPHPAVGVIFQEPRLLPWLTVAQNIGFGLSALSRAEREARVEEALLRVGLAGYGGRWPRELSGGQAQRVAIVRALVARPKVLLLDEPFSALDAFTRASLHEHLIGLWEAHKPTLLLVTHDVEEAVTLADRVIVLQPKPGRIFAEPTLDLTRPRDKVGHDFADAKRRILAALDGSLQAPSPTRPREEIAGAWW